VYGNVFMKYITVHANTEAAAAGGGGGRYNPETIQPGRPTGNLYAKNREIEHGGYSRVITGYFL